MELESDLAKELYNKVIVPIQTKNENAQKEYDVNNKKLEEELIAQEAATKVTTDEGPLPVSSIENMVNDSQGQSIMPPTPPTIQTCRANERDINPSEDCNPSTQKPKPKAWLIFHPDKNEKCADVATEKFKELTNVCKTYTSSPSQPNASDTSSQSVPSDTSSQPEPSDTSSQPEPSETPTIDILEPLSSETPIQSDSSETIIPDTLELPSPEPSIQPKFDVNPLIQLLTTTFNKDLTQTVNKSGFDTGQLLNVLSTTLSNTKESETVSRGMPPSLDISLNNIITSCDGEPCDDPENLQQPSTGETDSVSPSIEGDVQSTSEPGSSWVTSLTSMLSMPSKPSTPSMPSVDISGKMNWITQSLVALFATVGNLFTFKPAEDNDPYKIPSTKESEGYIYIGKMYMKEEDENSPSKQVKYINYNPEKKDFYIDERPEVVEQIN